MRHRRVILHWHLRAVAKGQDELCRTLRREVQLSVRLPVKRESLTCLRSSLYFDSASSRELHFCPASRLHNRRCAALFYCLLHNYMVDPEKKETLLAVLERVDWTKPLPLPQLQKTLAPKKCILHLDELQSQYIAGSDFYSIRRGQVSNTGASAAKTVAIMSLIQHFNDLAQKVSQTKVVIVYSGVDFRGSEAVGILSTHKYVAVTIPPITENFASQVLKENGVVLTNEDEEGVRSLVGGSLGQIACVIQTSVSGKAQWNMAFVEWFAFIQQRMRVSAGEALSILCLFALRNDAASCSTYSWDQPLASFPFLDATGAAHSSWLRILSDAPLRIESPSPWHVRAFDTLIRCISKLYASAFHTLNAAADNDPQKQKGLLFQLLFATELFENSSSPLFTALGAAETSFSSFERYSRDPATWLEGVLYLVTESSFKKTGDIVFRDADRVLFVLELKNSDSPHYLTDGLKKFQQNANIASAQYRYVSATGVVLPAVESRPNVRAVTNVGTLKGLNINIAPTLESLKLPEFARTVIPNKSRPVDEFTLSRIESFIVGKRPRAVDNVAPPTVPCPIWVRYGDSIFKVTPATSDVDSLKKAVKAEMQLQQPAPTLVVKDHTLMVLEVDSLLESNNKDTAYVVE